MNRRPWEYELDLAELLSCFGRSTRANPVLRSRHANPSAGSANQQIAPAVGNGHPRSSSATQHERARWRAGTPSARSAAQQDAIERFIGANPILPFLEDAGCELTRVGRSNGGEWAASCPLCGGRDRLRAWPSPPDGRPRAWCRQCGRSGDALAWATLLAGRDPKVRGSTAATLRELGYLEGVRRG